MEYQIIKLRHTLNFLAELFEHLIELFAQLAFTLLVVQLVWIIHGAVRTVKCNRSFDNLCEKLYICGLFFFQS